MDKGDPAACDGRNGKATRARFSGLDAALLRYAIKNYDSTVSDATKNNDKHHRNYTWLRVNREAIDE
ncbi:hypothetical protein [Novosphingobium sp. 28-62-57]|uniref:hypothetical protein n=1 Tax=Novosphingobium sp. 28-62-57 TaxID=1970409 RepID=UPI0025F66040|nr:hypothetical protein [Novosphingobium sp. 28-62-57]